VRVVLAPGRLAFPAIVVLMAGCRESATTVQARKPAAIAVVASPAATVTVGASAGTFSVRVTDAAGAAVPGAMVSFRITRGGGLLSPAIDTSDAAGAVSTTYTAATFPGVNDISAFVSGAAGITVSVAGTAGAARAVTFSVRSIRYAGSQDSALVTATPRDTFANASGTPIVWLARDPTLVSVTPALTISAVVRVLRRPGSTYLIASSGAAIDSIPVVVVDSTSTPCSFIAASNTLALGASLAFDGGVTCIRSAVAGAEYAVIAHLNTAADGVGQSVAVVGDGLVTPLSVFPLMAQEALPQGATTPGDMRDHVFEHAMRERERREIGPRLAAARAVFGTRAGIQVAPTQVVTHALPAVARVGDLVSLNVNAQSFCGSPDARTARVAAVTDGAIVMADVDNPPNGFTDTEYRDFALALDTLVTPVDTTAFGAPTDVDHNGRVGVFFTRAVNELTPQAAPSLVLGFYYLRDLLPRQSPNGDCPGSNVGEMFYLLVPDPAGSVNNNPRTKAFVATTVVGTIGHEMQHLINASRRMYINDALRVDEEVWLNEGLSHIAEELLFFRASGSGPRLNIGGGQLALGSPMRFAFDAYERNNFARYREYQRATESKSPLASDGGLATRGATWSFLRYLADRVRSSDGDFWRRLVNARTTGTVNLDSALVGTGVTTLSGLRDWSISVLTDDNPPTTEPALQQLSWNLISAMPALGGGLTFGLSPRVLTNQLSTGLGLVGGGSGYLRFVVQQGQEALIRVTALGGGPLPAGINLSIVRIK
jgi:hypothetical protein